jgi:hypothetical protein
MDRLYVQLHRWAATPHEWSYCDCYMVVADWVRIVRGFDPGEELRGSYGDPAVCPRARALRADPVPVGRRLLAALPETDAPVFGDVAFVHVPGARFLCGAIRLKGNAWAMKTESQGVQVSRFVRPEIAWSVGYAP